MRVMIFGGRFRIPKKWVFTLLDMLIVHIQFPNDTVIIEGEASGVDTFAADWARKNGFLVDPYKVDKKLDGGTRDAAPLRRNVRMYEQSKPDLAIAFPGGPGTDHMRGLLHGLRVIDVDIERDGTFSVWDLDPGKKPIRLIAGKLFNEPLA